LEYASFDVFVIVDPNYTIRGFFMTKSTSALLFSSLFLSLGAINAEEIDHSKMDHSKHMMMGKTAPSPLTVPMQSTPASEAIAPPPTAPMQRTLLSEAGNDIFGTLQEVIKKLDANPKTDWSKVDLEALRQHLIDMKHFTVDVTVISQKNTKKGNEISVKATTEAAHKALKRAMSAHPAMLTSETGWAMTAQEKGDTFVLTISTDKPAEIARLRGLGYIGIMALGNHHQVHHWMMASGSNPHGKHQHH
jgi:hypothetical protein